MSVRLKQAAPRQTKVSCRRNLPSFSSRSHFCSFQFASSPVCPNSVQEQKENLPRRPFARLRVSVPTTVAGCYLRPRRHQLTGRHKAVPLGCDPPNMHQGLFASSFQILITGGIRFSSSPLHGSIRRRRSPRGQPCPVAAS